MPNKRIDQLNENLDPLNGSELIPIFDSVNNKTERVSLNTIFNFIDDNVTGNTLSQTLSIGNTTGGNDIELTTGDKINISGSKGEITYEDIYGLGIDAVAIKQGVDKNNVMFIGDRPLNNVDYFNVLLNQSNAQIMGLYTNNTAIETTSNSTFNNNYIGINAGDSNRIQMYTYGTGTNSIELNSEEIFFGAAGRYPLWLCDNRTSNQTANNDDKYGVFVGTRNSTINSGVTNSVVVGGTGIVASENNTVYVPDVVVQSGKEIKSGISGLTASIKFGSAIPTSDYTIGQLSVGTFQNNLLSPPLTPRTGFRYVGTNVNDYIDVFSSGDGGFEINKSSNTEGNNRVGIYVGPNSNNQSFLEMYDDGYSNILSNGNYLSGRDIATLGTYVSFNNNQEVSVQNNSTGNKTSRNTDKRATFVGTRNSTINSGVTNSVVVGGTGIVASANNTVYVPDVVVQSGKAIKSDTKAVDFGWFGQDVTIYNNPDGSNAYINLSTNRIDLYVDNGSTNMTLDDGNGAVIVSNNKVRLSSGYIDMQSRWNGGGRADTIRIFDNATLNSVSSNTDKPSVMIGSRNSTINSGVTNSVVVGGTGIVASANNTVYVPDLVIQNNKYIKTSDDITRLRFVDTGDFGGGVFLTGNNGKSIEFNNSTFNSQIGIYGGTDPVYIDGNYVTISSNSGTDINGTLKMSGLPIYADNGTAVAGGLTVDTVYKTATGELRIVV